MLGVVHSESCLSCSLGAMQKHASNLSWTLISDLGSFNQFIVNVVKISSIINYFLSEVKIELVLINTKLRFNFFNSFQKILLLYS